MHVGHGFITTSHCTRYLRRLHFRRSQIFCYYVVVVTPLKLVVLRIRKHQFSHKTVENPIMASSVQTSLPHKFIIDSARSNCLITSLTNVSSRISAKASGLHVCRTFFQLLPSLTTHLLKDTNFILIEPR